jgi:dipeptidyl aminopeptidase/acylaminoacyl peptidase
MYTVDKPFHLVNLIWLAVMSWAVPVIAGEPPTQDNKRPVTVSDSIRMTHAVGWPPAHFSPDGSRLVVILEKGNLEHNTVDYSLLLWRTRDTFDSPAPEVIVTLSSSSNRAAIENITWLSDNETVAFLGEHPGESHQLYTVNTKTHALKLLTSHATNILAYSLTPKGDYIAYTAEPTSESIWNDKTNREGVVVATQRLLSLLQGKADTEHSTGYPLFVCHPGEPGRILETQAKVETRIEPALSPNGKYVVIATEVREFPDYWKDYTDPDIRFNVSAKLGPGQTTWLQRLELIDTTTHQSRFLISSPAGVYGSEVAWSPDSSSVALTRVFLPLDNTESNEREARQSKSFTVEVNVSSGEISKISEEDLYGVDWDAKAGGIISHVMQLESNTVYGLGETVFFAKEGTNWHRVKDVGEFRPEILVEEDMLAPPRIFARDSKTGRENLLLDLNPQFRELKFGNLEEIHWKGTDGHDVKGGLYYPVHYTPGKAYPLVIQTHGWTPKQFLIDGPYTTAEAAQALAAHDLVVLQADDSNLKATSNLDEAPREVATYEGAIDYLDRKGLIDRNRVGIIGFSRSCFFVKYALTHSTYHFAAASVTDGIDAGYFQYIGFSNAFPTGAADDERLNDGHPWGQQLGSWLSHSPGFNVDKAQTPLLITALNPGSLLGEWEWFALLLRMGRPVEMIYLRDGEHQLVKPWDRMVSQQGNVDWFRFWLKAEEDPDPAKGEQYKRWHELRKLQQEDQSRGRSK